MKIKTTTQIAALDAKIWLRIKKERKIKKKEKKKSKEEKKKKKKR